MPSLEDQLQLFYRGKIAVITLNRAEKLNALDRNLYHRLSCLMREVAARSDIYITILTGKGRYFSAGADVSLRPRPSEDEDLRRHALRYLASENLDITNAFYTHPKILVTALNGPAIGLSAALISFSDFIYAAPHAFLLTPFASLGIVAEAASSVSFVQRLGISKANEALIMGKKITASEMLQVGFINKIINTAKDEPENFLEEVIREVEDKLGDHLNNQSLLKIKALIRKPERAVLDGQAAAEFFGLTEMFALGIPQEEFRKIASGEKKHKL